MGCILLTENDMLLPSAFSMRPSCDCVCWVLTPTRQPCGWSSSRMAIQPGGEKRLWPSVPPSGLCHKREGASSLFIFSTGSSGSICIVQHSFCLAYTSSVRGSLTSTSFLLDSEILNFVSHKRCDENTLSGDADCWILAVSCVSMLGGTNLGFHVQQLHQPGVATAFSWALADQVMHVSFWA